MEESVLRRTWAEVDLDALAHNYRQARRMIGAGVRYLGVVKADAYGHGAVQVGRKLEALGADYLAVSSLDEARELRHGGISMPILILGHTPPEMVPELIRHHITQTVSARAKAEEYSAAAAACGGTLRVHIKVDTGMSRLGFLVRGEHFDGGVEAIAASCRLPHLEAEGIFTHFAAADEDDPGSEAYTPGAVRCFSAGAGGSGRPGADICHPALCQQRRPGPLSGDVSGYGASGYCAVRCRSRRPASGPAARDDAQILRVHHQDF